MSGTVLIIEDEASLADSVRYNLEREGFRVLVADNGRQGLELFVSQGPDLIVLDLMIPEVSGLDVCRRIRQDSNVPILMLTAKDSEADKVAGLELGADDYMTKPFSMRELVSRVRALLRRSGMASPEAPGSVLFAGKIRLDPDRHEVRVDGEIRTLTPKEFGLLELFLERKGRLLTRDLLIDEIWGPEHVGDSKTLDVHIKRLRQKVEPDPGSPTHIQTVRGLGYKFVDGP